MSMGLPSEVWRFLFCVPPGKLAHSSFAAPTAASIVQEPGGTQYGVVFDRAAALAKAHGSAGIEPNSLPLRRRHPNFHHQKMSLSYWTLNMNCSHQNSDLSLIVAP